MAMRIVLDATPLFGARTGVGRYVQQLISRLPAAIAERVPDAEIRAATWTARGGTLDNLPPGIPQLGIRIPSRVLFSFWERFDRPRIENFVGDLAVFHGTNFVVPPTRGAREVVTIHDLTYLHHTDTVTPAVLRYQRLIARALDRGAHVLTPTQTIADAVRNEYGLSSNRVTATLLGVDESWFAAQPDDELRTRLGLPERYVLFIGNLDPRKNLPRLIRAHRAARSADRDVPDLVLAGPAGREEHLAGPGVHLTGWLDDDEIQSLVAGASALALPSIDEGFGLPAAEALACGRPLLVSDIPVLHEVAGDHAYYCDPRDVTSIAIALAQALGAPDDDTARAGRQEWARRFSWEKCAQLTAKAYLS